MLASQVVENFHFLRPAWGLLFALPLLTLVLQWRERNGSRAWDSVIAPHLLEALRLRQFRNRLFSPVPVAVLLMIIMTLVAMGPTWRQQPSPLTRDEAALIVLLDTSSSMQETDIQPSRLVRARQKISDLLELRPGSRTALVVYAGSAHTVLDLTDDPDILTQYLSAIDPRIMPRSGKFAEYTLPLVERIIGDDTAPTTVLLLTDGVAQATGQAFADWFSARPHQLLVWGIGSEQVNEGGAPLETRSLKALARQSGGSYITLSLDSSDVRDVDRRVNAHYVVSENSAVPWMDGGYWLVFPCIALFLLWFRRGWTLQWALAGLLLGGGLFSPQQARAEGWFTDLWLTPDQQGRLLFSRGDYREAAERFANPEWKGLAWYYAEEFDLAAEYFSRVDTPRARFNRANALAHGQHYLRALALYEQLLAEDADNKAAERNRRIVQDLVDAINNMSESQQQEGGSRELGDDQPRRAEGAEVTEFAEAELEQFSADQILQDERINEMWMRSVQRDPSHFLSIKFSMQLEQREDSP